jgi:hypothetical protein
MQGPLAGMCMQVMFNQPMTRIIVNVSLGGLPGHKSATCETWVPLSATSGIKAAWA